MTNFLVGMCIGILIGVFLMALTITAKERDT